MVPAGLKNRLVPAHRPRPSRRPLRGLLRMRTIGWAPFTRLPWGTHADMRRIDWVVYAKKPVGGPAQVLAYLGRYTHRVAMPTAASLPSTPLMSHLEGLSPERCQQNHAVDAGRVHPALPSARFPDGFHRIHHFGFWRELG